MTDTTTHRHPIGKCPRCRTNVHADVTITTEVRGVRIEPDGSPKATAYANHEAVLFTHTCGTPEGVARLLTVRADRAKHDRTERQTWLAGNEDGEAVIQCAHPSCMVDGPCTSYNREGRYIGTVELPYHATPEEVQALWDAHIARHNQEEGEG